MISEAVQRTLTSKPILMSHPSSLGLTDLYSSVSNSTSHLVETQNKSGATRISANSKALGATSNFSISSSLLNYGFTLNMSVTIPANHILNQGWGLAAIDYIELSFPNSLAQNMLISGTALRDYLLYCQPDNESRSNVLQQCGQAVAGAGTYKCSVPLASLLTRSTVGNSFPIDMAALNSFLQINITFKPAQGFIMVDSTDPAFNPPVQFNTLELVTSSCAILDGGYSVRNALLMDPTSTYNIPTTWVAPYRYVANIDPTGVNLTELSITSCPKGFLNGCLFSVFPTVENTGAANAQTALFPSCVNLSSLQIQYNGQDIYRADSSFEIDSYSRLKHNGDNLGFQYPFYRVRNTANPSRMDARVYFIPFNYNSGLVRDHIHCENLPSYDGATLQFKFSVDEAFNRTYNTAANPYFPAALALGGALPFTIEITWLLSALLEVNSSSVDIMR